MGRARVQGNMDIYNLFNGDAVLFGTTRFGSRFLRPTTTLGGRLFKFGGQIDF